MKKIIAFTLIAGLFTACKKETENSKITITIQSPTEGTAIMSGDSLVVIANVTSSINELHEIGFVITKPATSDTIWTWSEHSHDKNLNINQKVLINVSSHSDLLLTVMAEDHDENKASATRNFHCHP